MLVRIILTIEVDSEVDHDTFTFPKSSLIIILPGSIVAALKLNGRHLSQEPIVLLLEDSLLDKSLTSFRTLLLRCVNKLNFYDPTLDYSFQDPRVVF